jgi:hypothetical protein
MGLSNGKTASATARLFFVCFKPMGLPFSRACPSCEAKRHEIGM